MKKKQLDTKFRIDDQFEIRSQKEWRRCGKFFEALFWDIYPAERATDLQCEKRSTNETA